MASRPLLVPSSFPHLYVHSSPTISATSENLCLFVILGCGLLLEGAGFRVQGPGFKVQS